MNENELREYLKNNPELAEAIENTTGQAKVKALREAGDFDGIHKILEIVKRKIGYPKIERRLKAKRLPITPENIEKEFRIIEATRKAYDLFQDEEQQRMLSRR